jgi:hypothetical protein
LTLNPEATLKIKEDKILEMFFQFAPGFRIAQAKSEKIFLYKGIST